MNLTMVELSARIKARVGDTVVLIGQQGQLEITADEIAKKISTINYEVATRINPEILRLEALRYHSG
jgi:alanine racemase